MPNPRLVEELSSFTPRLLVTEFSPQGAPITEPAVRGLRAVVMFADISGFTPLTERLAARGPAGVEELTRILNHYFGGLIDTVHAAGGDILKFAGDALLALWQLDGRDHGEEVARAAGCGLEVQRVFARLQAQDAKLSIKIGIGAGPLSVFAVGGVLKRWELVASGEALRQIGAAAHCAHPGDVMLSAAALDLAGTRLTAEPAEEAFRLVGADTPAARPVPAAARVATPDLLRGFIPAAVLSPLQSGGAEWVAEMRRVTVMFILFPGLTHATPVARAQGVMAMMQQEIYRHEGSVNKLSVDDKGSAMLAAFGLPPLAHGDDPARAAAAALAIHGQLEEFNVRHSVGIATGRAFCGVIGNRTRREYTMIGDVVNLAARLMTASTGEIRCDETTQESARTRHPFTALPPISLKGKAQPLRVYRPELERAVQSAELPMVGRKAELEAILSRLRALTAEGRGGLMLLEGGPGIGKSRLATAFVEEARAAGATVLRGAALAMENATPFFAWRELFQDLLGVRHCVDREARRAQVSDRVADASPGDVPLLPLLNPVVLTDFGETGATAVLRDQARGVATMELLGRLLAALPAAAERKVVLVEDGHWFDSASWSLAGVAQGVPGLLLLVTLRPVAAIPDAAGANSSTLHLRLQPLDGGDCLQVVANRLGVDALPESLAALISERAEGSPLFSEELAYALRDSGAIVIEGSVCRLGVGDLRALAIPNTVQAAMTSRIDRLPVDSQLALKTASVIGRVFESETLRAVCPVGDRRVLPEIVTGLVERDLLRNESSLDDVYEFKHALLQDVAYDLMLGAQRRKLHRAVGEWMEGHSEGLRGRYASLAYHWGRVLEYGDTSLEVLAKALDYCQKAAEESIAAFAHHEAAGFLHEALRLLARLPETPERGQREFALQMMLGPVMLVTRGWAAAETEQAFNRAWELCRHTGDPAMQAPILYGIWNFHVVSARHRRAFELAEELFALAQPTGDPMLLGSAHRALMEVNFWTGSFEPGMAHIERGAEYYDPSQAERELRTTGVHSGVICLGFEAWLAWQLGDAARARDAAKRQMDLAAGLKNPFCLGAAHMNNAILYQFLGDAARVRSLAVNLTQLSRDNGLSIWLAGAAVMLGWAMVETGEVAAGIAEAERGIDAWQATGADLAGPYYFSLLAAGYRCAGQCDRARELVERGVEQAERTGEVWWLAEVLRLRASFQARPEAEVTLHRALAIARRQKARFLALRAACSLAELLHEPKVISDQLGEFAYPDSEEVRRAQSLLSSQCLLQH